MNRKQITVAVLAVVVLAFFLLGMNAYRQRVQNAQAEKASQEQSRLVRAHSPVLGPRDAPVTIVEFFDPACETCRAFYPIVKNLMQQHPADVRLVIRYAPFHPGSDQVVRLLEAARLQDRYEAVLEMLLATQPQWADHARPDLAVALRAAEAAGLDLKQAMADAGKPAIDAVLQQDVEDLTALEVRQTPTFFVNGRALPSFGAEPLAALVAEELASKRR